MGGIFESPKKKTGEPALSLTENATSRVINREAASEAKDRNKGETAYTANLEAVVST